MLNIIVIVADETSDLGNFGIYLEKRLCKKVKYLSETKSILDAFKKKLGLLLVKYDSLNFDSFELIKKIIEHSPFTSIAILSNDSANKIECKFEGFGILMQLSNPPSEYEAEMLCKKVFKLSNNS